MAGPERAAKGGPALFRPGALGVELKFLGGVGPRRAEILERLGLVTVGDLLHHFPRRHEDRRRLRRIGEAVVGETQVLHGVLDDVRERLLKGGRTLVEAKLRDAPESCVGESSSLEILGGASARLDLVWFNQPYLVSILKPGLAVYVHGQVKLHQGKLQMVSPEFELDLPPQPGDSVGDASPHVKRIVPVYPLTKGLHQRYLRGLVFRVLQQDLPLGSGPYDVFYPGALSSIEAYRGLHFPSSFEDLARARERFLFEETFCFASHLAFRRLQCRQPTGSGFSVTEELDRKIRSVFPFSFTREQDRVVQEIVSDLRGPGAMYRLLQGDVGTGKTAVALYAMLVAVRNRRQAALMAPTEILAEQHYRTIADFLQQHPVRVGLLTGSVRSSARREILEGLASGRCHIAVGTHALVQDDVTFRRLGLVVIDEQHRFGVRERMRLRRRGDRPHVLVMTATPIPRSLCLTAYGDLDLSVLRERPRGRQPVKTYLVTARQRPRAMEFIRRELRSGRQAYFVYPLIDESETLALPAATRAHEHLSRHVFPEYRVGLVHGKMPASEKDRELERFRSRHYQVLVATVVVEVGIDVPNASVLFIEDASRFGLAQLHQLRGRVGRGFHAGYCLVAIDRTSRDVLSRLKAFSATEDGFKIAEEDLKLRGPGDYLGVRQSGRPHFLLGNPLENLPEFLRVKALADTFWSAPENQKYRAQWALLLGEGPRGMAQGGDGFLGLD